MTLPVNKPLAMTIRSTPAHVPVARAAVERLCGALGIDAGATGQIALSLDEALANIIKHAYEGADDRPIEVEITPTGTRGVEMIQIRLRDYGRSVDPSEIRSRELHDVRPGGLGVHIMNEYMDTVDYTPADGGGTVLTLTKKFPGKDST